MDNCIVDVEAPDNHIQVFRLENGKYNVVNNDTVRHPECDPESAMRALGFYLNGVGFRLEKLLENK